MDSLKRSSHDISKGNIEIVVVEQLGGKQLCGRKKVCGFMVKFISRCDYYANFTS